MPEKNVRELTRQLDEAERTRSPAGAFEAACEQGVRPLLDLLAECRDFIDQFAPDHRGVGSGRAAELLAKLPKKE